MSEILGALFKYLVAILAIAAVVVVLYETLSSNKASSAIADITTLQADISQLYSGSNSASLSLTNSDITSQLAQSNSAPSSMISGSTLVNPWGGAVKVNVFPAVSPLPASGTIEFDSVPNNACVKIISSILPSVKIASVNGTNVTSVTNALQACTSPTSSNSSSSSMNSNNIVVYFYLS